MKAFDFCKEHSACYDGREWSGDRTMAQVWSECERGDWLIWCLRRSGKMDKMLVVKIAVECAKHALHLYTGKSDVPRKAIEAAENWIENPTAADAAAAYADAADAAAYAAAAAAAYADAADAAAYAAAAAAAAAADAADADAAAAYAAAAAYVDAAAAAAAAERKWQADKIREIVGGNPFQEAEL